jgi:hypothetical protein
MTVLGKMLVFLVLVLSLVWNGLVVNAYVTRTNWKAESKRSQDRAAEAADSANKMKALLDAEREGSEDARRALRDENYQLAKQVATLKTRLDDLNKQYKDAFDKGQQDNVATNQLQENIKKLETQLGDANALLSAKEKQVDDLTKAAEKDRVAAQKASLDAQAQAQRADRLAARVQELAERLEEMQRNGVRAPSPGVNPDRPQPAPPGFRGTVERVVRDGNDYLITLKPGLDAGLVRGAELSIARLQPTPRYIGKLIVVLADPKEAVGRFVPPEGRRLGPDDLPKPGDELTPSR